MPAKHMTYPNGGAILPVRRLSRVSGPSRILLDQTYLLGFGDMLIPRHLWIAMQRFDAWIEPALVSEWTRLIKFYASRRGERVDDGKIAVAMTWEVPTRDVRLAREQADQAFEKWPTVLRLERQAPFGRVNGP